MTNITRNWELWLLMLTLAIFIALSVVGRYLPLPQTPMMTQDELMPQIPEIVPWREQPLPFIQPDISEETHTPFAVTFHFPVVQTKKVVPAVENVMVATHAPETTQEAPPPPPPTRTVQITYNGIYTGILGTTVAMLELSDNFGWHSKENPKVGESLLGILTVQEITREDVVIKANDGRRWTVKRRGNMEINIPK